MHIESILFVIVLIFSVVLHELAHGYAADSLGDPSPRAAGRLTLNPLAHLDWFGSVILPTLLIISGSPILFGWAKPVPFNPNYLRTKKWGGALVALAGPMMNFFLAFVFALFLHSMTLSPFMQAFFANIVLTNIALAIFNLVPIPPLDGHHILYAVLGNHASQAKAFLQRYAMVILIIFIIYGWKFISPLVLWFYHLLVF